MEDFDLSKALDEALKSTEPPVAAALTEASPTDPPEGAALNEALQTDLPQGAAFKNATEVPDITSLESILLRLPPEGRAWFNGLNAYCRWAVDYDLRTEPDSLVEHWEYLRDTLQKLERAFGPSDNWK